MPGPAITHLTRRDALARLPEAALECTVDGRVVAANDLALGMFGVGAEDIVGGPADAWLSGHPALEAIADGAERLPVQGRRANGVPFPLRASVTRLRAVSGEPRALWRLRELERGDLVAAARRFFEAGFEHAPIGMRRCAA